MRDKRIFHVCKRAEWEEAAEKGCYCGSSQDGTDGFIHFSSADQLVESVHKHRAGQDGLVLIEVAAGALGDALRWETSRGGMQFPHLYGSLPLTAVSGVYDLPLGADGCHVFPRGLEDNTRE